MLNPDYSPQREDRPRRELYPRQSSYPYTIYFSWNHPSLPDYTPLRVVGWLPPWRRLPDFHVPVIVAGKRRAFPTACIRAVDRAGARTLRQIKTSRFV